VGDWGGAGRDRAGDCAGRDVPGPGAGAAAAAVSAVLVQHGGDPFADVPGVRVHGAEGVAAVSDEAAVAVGVCRRGGASGGGGGGAGACGAEWGGGGAG